MQSDAPPPIGHNRPPKAKTWTEYCWGRAQAEAWKSPPIEVVRRRVRAAGRLGLSYRDYTAVLLDRGVHLRLVVLGWEGVVVRAGALGPGVAAKLARVDRTAVLAAPGAGEAADPALLRRLGLTALPPGADLLAALAARGVRPDAVAMVGAGPAARRAAEQAGLGRFLWTGDYF